MKKKVLKILFFIIVIIFVIYIALSLWAADIVSKRIDIAQLVYLSNGDISGSRNLHFEEYYYLSKEGTNNASDYEVQETSYILDDVTKRITYYPLKKIKLTQISYSDKEINYLENEDGSIKIMYEESYPATKAEIYEVPNKNDEELGKLSSIFPIIFNSDNIDAITHFKLTEGVEDGIKCYIIKDETDDGYCIQYIDGSGFCFKTVETKIDSQSGKEEKIYSNTRKATFNSVTQEDVAELNKNEFTIVSGETFQEQFSSLLDIAQ